MPHISKFVAIASEFMKTLVIMLAATLLVRQFLAQPFFVDGLSMAPAFSDGELLIFEKVSYRFRPPARGEVITLKSPYRDRGTLLKRIVGLPGETVSIGGGKVRIENADKPDGFTLDESAYTFQPTLGELRVSLGPDEYFVLGDDRALSSDSREFGAVKRTDILGRVWLILFPVSRLRVL